MKNLAIQMRGFLLDLLFPVFCINCGQEGEYLCSECLDLLIYKKSLHCLKCKKQNTESSICPECISDYYINEIFIAGDYENKILAKLIKGLKYKFVTDYAKILGDFLSNYLLEKSKVDFSNIIIMPVPLHKKRWRWRGFNQSEKIAEIISKNLNLDIDNQSLARIKHKKAQAKLNEKQRRKNIKNCFEFFGDNLKNKNIILIDDVTTTGSTLDECARILKDNGAGNIWGLVVANG